MQREEQQIASKILICYREGRVEKAIELAREAVKKYPAFESFSCILGDMLFEEGDYETAGMAYTDFLLKISNNVRYFKKFADFWEKYKSAADFGQAQKVYDRIEKLFEQDKFSLELKKRITSLMFDFDESRNLQFRDAEKNESSLTKWINKKEEEKEQWEIYCFLFWEKQNGYHNRQTYQRDKKLVAIMEKYELYDMALEVTECMLDYVTDEVVTRTLFRLCRKINDYTKADEYMKKNSQVSNNGGFNIQYEFVYYYLEKGDENNLLGTLKKIRNSAESSLPISRTLQNFYVKLGMIDDAVDMRKHIAELQKNRKGNKKNRDIDTKGVEEEKETEEVFWDTIKDMVSEQEHNRQLIAMKEILKGFSHELGQPVTNIRYGVQLYQMKIERGLNTKENLEELLNNVLNQTVRMDRLLKRVSPIVSSKSVEAPFNCIEHIRTVFEDMRGRLDSIGIETTIGGTSSFMLYGDSVQFEQVITNLVSNAIDELREKPGRKEITVICREQAKRLDIQFRDNGRGIPEEMANKIFNPFYSNKGKENSDGGEGLGLYIVWNILKIYGGKIRVNSAYKAGAEFLIQIPKGESVNV